MPERYWVETLGCPKNQVDTDKIVASLLADGYAAASEPGEADLVVVNTCGFIDAARAESMETILDMEAEKRSRARLVVTGCLAARDPSSLADTLPGVDVVAGFGVPVALRSRKGRRARREAPLAGVDLLDLPRSAPGGPWAYVKVAEGCDRKCGFSAIPSFRGPQRSRSVAAILEEIDALVVNGVREVVLVAQDLASYGRDDGRGGTFVDLVEEVTGRVARVRLLYLYPTSLDDRLIDAIIESGVAYFDLSLQHVARPLLRRMRRPGSGEHFLERIATIRARAGDAALRSNFILGYPGETEEDHDSLLSFIEEAQLDWAGFFRFSLEQGTYAADLEGQVAPELAEERLRECTELQDAITARRQSARVGTSCAVLVDTVGVARSYREAPEIDGIIKVPHSLVPGTLCDVEIVAAEGTDLVASPVRVEALA